MQINEMIHILKNTDEDKQTYPSIISSRIRFVRNIKNYPFSHLLSDEKKEKMENDIIGHIKSWQREAVCHDMERLNVAETAFFYDNNIINDELMEEKCGKFIVFPEVNENKTTVLLNFDNHLNISVTCPGLYTNQIYSMAEQVEKNIGEKFTYAASARFGYLTPFINDCGLGLKISILVQLAGLHYSNKMEEIESLFTERGYLFTPWSYNDRKITPGYYIVSTRLNFGITEKNLVSRFAEGIKDLLEINNELLVDFIEEKGLEFKDNIFRSMGILQYARQIEFEEAFMHLSNIRMGHEIGEEMPLSLDKINKVFQHIKDGYISKFAENKSIGVNEARAEVIKQIINLK